MIRFIDTGQILAFGKAFPALAVLDDASVTESLVQETKRASTWLALSRICDVAVWRQAAMSARTLARNSSMETSLPPRSTFQKVQPLQEGKPCVSAPILWIEPTMAPSASVPSARTTALWRR